MNGTTFSNLGAKKVVPTNETKLMMPRLSVKVIVQKESRLQPTKILTRWMKNGSSVSHWCGACHKDSNGKVK